MNRELTYLTENNGSRSVRVLGTPDAPLFVAADVCAVLEISNHRKAAGDLDADEKGVTPSDTPGGPQELLVVTEAGLYRLIMRSRKPEARRFARWVTHDVLPEIRRTGAYASRPARHNELDPNLLRADLLTAERILSRPPIADTDADALKATARLLLATHRPAGRGIEALIPPAIPYVEAQLAPAHVGRGNALDQAAVLLKEEMARLQEARIRTMGGAELPIDQVVEAVARQLYGDAEVSAAARRLIEQGVRQGRRTVEAKAKNESVSVVCARVLHQVRTHPGGSGRSVVRGVRAARHTVLDALRHLEARGLVTHQPGPRGARLWSPAAEEVSHAR